MALLYQPYNLSLPSFSPVFNYTPYRDGGATLGWNSSFSVTKVSELPVSNSGFNIGQGIAYRTTEYDGAAVALEFNGTAVYFCLQVNGTASYDFLVDGQPSITSLGNETNPVCAVYGGQPTILVQAEDLPDEMHTATLRVSVPSNGNVNFYGGTVTINAGAPGPKTTKVISDQDGGWNYNGEWDTYVDDANMWNGKYHATSVYGSQMTASYTFQGANAIVLTGVSMFEYGPYTITLDSSGPETFNASDLWWRHSPAVLYFAGGLDASRSYTITVMNYDVDIPDAHPVFPGGNVAGSVGTLTLIMDDATSRNALIASLPSAPTPSSSVFSAGSIAAVVLGALLFLMLAVIGVLVFQLNRQTRSRISENEVVQLSPDLMPWVPSTSEISSPIDRGRRNAQRRGKRSQVAVQGASNESPGRSPLTPERSDRPAEEPERSSPHDNTHPGPQLPPGNQRPSSHALGDIMESLSNLLNGHLRQEYLQRDGSDRPPEYADG